MALNDKRYALTGLTEMQARLIVQMAQHLQAVFKGEMMDATIIMLSMHELCAENPAEANQVSKMIERLHEQVGCCDHCRHKKEESPA